MKIKEAIGRIEVHKEIHFLKEPRAIKITEALNMAIDALKKQDAIKPIYSDYEDNGDGEVIPYKAKCPICGYDFEFGTWNEFDNHHCVCGQKIDWQ